MSESHRSGSHFSQEYIELLQAHYPANIVADITDNWQYADLATPADEQIAYVRVNHGVSRPVLYVPGFTEGIIAKAPFAADLANRDYDVILPDQNRKKILKDAASGKKDATYTQAENYLSVLAAEDLLHDGPVDVVAHSYGGLIFEAMHKLAVSRGFSAFKGSRVVLLASAGFNDDENMPSLAYRFMAMNRSESKSPKQFGEAGAEMLKGGIKNAMANIPRCAREGVHLARRKIDAAKLFAGGIGSLAVVTYGEDALYGDKTVYSTVERAVNAGASWIVPVEFDLHGPRGIEGATHNDEQFNPSRVARLVAHLLQNA